MAKAMSVFCCAFVAFMAVVAAEPRCRAEGWYQEAEIIFACEGSGGDTDQNLATVHVKDKEEKSIVVVPVGTDNFRATLSPANHGRFVLIDKTAGVIIKPQALPGPYGGVMISVDGAGTLTETLIISGPLTFELEIRVLRELPPGQRRLLEAAPSGGSASGDKSTSGGAAGEAGVSVSGGSSSLGSAGGEEVPSGASSSGGGSAQPAHAKRSQRTIRARKTAPAHNPRTQNGPSAGGEQTPPLSPSEAAAVAGDSTPPPTTQPATPAVAAPDTTGAASTTTTSTTTTTTTTTAPLTTLATTLATTTALATTASSTPLPTTTPAFTTDVLGGTLFVLGYYYDAYPAGGWPQCKQGAQPLGCREFDQNVTRYTVVNWAKWAQAQYPDANAAWQAIAQPQVGYDASNVADYVIPRNRWCAVWNQWPVAQEQAADCEEVYKLISRGGQEVGMRHVRLAEWTWAFGLPAVAEFDANCCLVLAGKYKDYEDAWGDLKSIASNGGHRWGCEGILEVCKDVQPFPEAKTDYFEYLGAGGYPESLQPKDISHCWLSPTTPEPTQPPEPPPTTTPVLVTTLAPTPTTFSLAADPCATSAPTTTPVPVTTLAPTPTPCAQADPSATSTATAAARSSLDAYRAAVAAAAAALVPASAPAPEPAKPRMEELGNGTWRGYAQAQALYSTAQQSGRGVGAQHLKVPLPSAPALFFAGVVAAIVLPRMRRSARSESPLMYERLSQLQAEEEGRSAVAAPLGE